MGQVTDFFRKLFDLSDFPPRWHCGHWTEFHGWLYIVSDLLIWSAYFTIPLIIIKYLSKKQDARFLKLYILFAAFIMACGATHFLDAVTFWLPLYRVSALLRFFTGAISWVTVWYLFKYLPVAFARQSVDVLEQEIQQRKKAEEELRLLNERLEDIIWKKTQEITATESRFRAIIESSKEAISMTDETFTPFYQNHCAEQLTGWSGYSKKEASLVSQTHPDDIEKLQIILGEVTANPGKAVPMSFRIQHAADNYIHIEGTVTNLLAHEHVKAIVFNFRDITERKNIEDQLIRSEATYRTIASNLPNCIITILDKNNRFLLASGDELATLGLTKAGIEGKTEQEALPPDIYTALSALRRKAFSGAMSLHEISFRNLYYLVRFIPLRDEKNEVYAVMTISLNITEIKKAEVQIMALNETLRRK